MLYSDTATDFRDYEMPKFMIKRLGCSYICLMVILIDFVVKKDENYYPQRCLNKR